MIPKIKIPYHPIVIPDNNKTIHIKPYTIEIEKYLVGLDNKEDLITQMNAIGELLKYCIVEDDFVLDDLSIGTIIWLFTKCYEISVKDTIDITLKHECIEGNNSINLSIKIKDIVYDGDFEPLLIDVDTEEGKYYLEFRCIRYKNIAYLKDESSNIELVASCLERMYDESGNNEVELTLEDKVTIVSSLPISIIQKIGDKIQDIRKPRYEVDYTCPHCGKHIKETLTDFFI